VTALWTAAEAAAATGGTARGDWAATGVSIDSRSLAPGDLFVALTAARDGHDFVADALARGAAAAMVARHPDGVAADAPLLVVPDVLEGLIALGRAGRTRMGGRVVAVTGSVGKTSTKEMLRVVLARLGATHAAEASHNNHWGVPLTLARMPAATAVAVVEIGMNHRGEIAPLARLARPDLALVTAIAPAHLENLGSIEAIAEEKADIFAGLAPGGVAVLPAGLPTTPILEARAAGCASRMIRFGPGGEAALTDVRVTPEATVAEASVGGRPVLFRLPGAGRHYASNALATLAVADALGADLALAALDLAGWSPPEGRGQRERVEIAGTEGHGFHLIDDAYNANPASLAAALEGLAMLTPEPPGRRVAILGDMLELGPDEAALHAAVADHPALEAVATVHCCGPRMAHLWEALPPARRGRRADTAEALAAEATELVRPGDILLVKGSKASGVSRVVDALRKLGQGGRRAARGD
jgi:UDP-N-acetylmuramoyl-tripeptide--D-alanyl-D-alanine ligase